MGPKRGTKRKANNSIPRPASSQPKSGQNNNPQIPQIRQTRAQARAISNLTADAGASTSNPTPNPTRGRTRVRGSGTGRGTTRATSVSRPRSAAPRLPLQSNNPVNAAAAIDELVGNGRRAVFSGDVDATTRADSIVVEITNDERREFENDEETSQNDPGPSHRSNEESPRRISNLFFGPTTASSASVSQNHNIGNGTDYQKALATRQQLDAQLSENTIVKTELDLLESEAKVYKMMGPVLIQQDLVEAKQTVGKRIEYINGDLKRQETSIKTLEKQQETYREKLQKLQQEFQKSQMQKMSGKS